MRSFALLAILLVSAFVLGCDQSRPAKVDTGLSLHEGFGEYWYDGTAEVSRYELSQARYGSNFEGEAALIFVTEPFLEATQVKADDAENPGAVTVLKLNATRNFTTGVYPYSTMTSTFSPVEIGSSPYPLKQTTSIQEWCGHTFSQYNLRGSQYDSEVRSYFEVEGDRASRFGAALTEDALFTRIRFSPDALPTGAIQLVPSQIHSRFTKRDDASALAEAALTEVEESPFHTGVHGLYQVTYMELNRVVVIGFEKEAPFKILGWSEAKKDGTAKTVARLASTKKLPYWSQNKPGDEVIRAEMGFSR